MATRVTISDTDDTRISDTIVLSEQSQKHVLRDFNPAMKEDDATGRRVDMTKVLCAAVIEQMLILRDAPNATNAQKRGAAIAITLMEGAQSAAVKANFAQA